MCGLKLYPWQEWLLIHMLELAPALTVSTMRTRGKLDPLFRFRKVVILVARQNGKSTLSQVLSLFFMYELGIRLTLGTAQDLDTAEEVWEGAWEIIEETPELADRALSPILVNGKKTIRLTTGERYKVKAANRKAGRGLSGDLILLDELREHQTWEAWAAITKTTQARPAALICALSNAGDASSLVLRHLRMTAHRALGDPDGICAAAEPNALLPDDDELDPEWSLEVSSSDIAEDFEEDEAGGSIGLFEWSARPDRGVRDREGWAESNPSLGYGISESTIAGDSVDDPEWVFRTEVMCQWSEGSLDGIFDPGTWLASTDKDSSIAPGGRIVGCLVVNFNRSRAHLAIAGYRADGAIHMGIAASRAGTAWVEAYLQDPQAPRIDTLVLQERGAPESSMYDDLQTSLKTFKRDDGTRISLHSWSGPELPRAHGVLFDHLREQRVWHRPQPLLDVAEAVAVSRPMSDAWMIDLRKSPGDAAPLKGVVGAVWGLENTKPPRRSAYSAEESDSGHDDIGLVVI